MYLVFWNDEEDGIWKEVVRETCYWYYGVKYYGWSTIKGAVGQVGHRWDLVVCYEVEKTPVETKRIIIASREKGSLDLKRHYISNEEVAKAVNGNFTHYASIRHFFETGKSLSHNTKVDRYLQEWEEIEE